ncbi:hypothetical protein HPB47_016364, partial [Ixodes persulcatus]
MPLTRSHSHAGDRNDDDVPDLEDQSGLSAENQDPTGNPGPDGVTNQAIRNLDESCHDSLLEYMNKVWSSAEIPRAWREATTVPLLQSVRPADALSSYRPISLTSCLGKLLERMVLRRLSCHLEAVDALPDYFTGKAFDALPHNTIFTALQNLGITRRPLSYIRAFLTERTLRVLVGNTYSTPRGITAGVPQESVLSPLPFSIAIASLPSAGCNAVLQKMRTRTNTLQTFGGTTWGTLQAMMLAMYKGLVVSCPTYALPLVTLNSIQQENPEKAQREGLRICLGTPRSASSHKTLVEAGGATICATPQKRALGHLIRMKNGRSMGSLILKTAQKTESVLGRALYQLGDIAGTAATLADLSPLQESPQALDVDLHIPEWRSSRTSTTMILRTLALSHIEEQYHGWTQVFTDGSVRPTDGSSPAAAAFEAAGVGLIERLTHHATITTTELAANLLALKTVQNGSTKGGKWVILCDSQAALSMLDNLDRGHHHWHKESQQ